MPDIDYLVRVASNVYVHVVSDTHEEPVECAVCYSDFTNGYLIDPVHDRTMCCSLQCVQGALMEVRDYIEAGPPADTRERDMHDRVADRLFAIGQFHRNEMEV